MQSLNVTSEPIYRSVSRNQGRAVFYLPSALLLCAVNICKLCLHCHDVCNVAPCKCISVNCVEILLNVKSSSAAGRTGNGLPTPSLRMDTPISGVSLHPFIMSKRLKRAHPFSVMEWVSHSQCVLQLMMTYPLNVITSSHETIIQTGITCNKISCYMHDSAYRWLIVGNAKVMLKFFWIFRRERNCRILIGLCK